MKIKCPACGHEMMHMGSEEPEPAPVAVSKEDMALDAKMAKGGKPKNLEELKKMAKRKVGK